MEPVPFRTLLLTEGVLTRDGRTVDPGACYWAVPQTLYAQIEDSHGGEPPVTQIAGRIDDIERIGDDVFATGQFTTDVGIYTVAPMVADNTLRGISVDLAPQIVEYRAGTGDDMAAPEIPSVLDEEPPVQETPEESAAPPEDEITEGETVHRESISDMTMAYVSCEIIAATICGKQAFGDAFIEITTPDNPVAPDVAETPAAALIAAGRPIVRVTTILAATPPPAAPGDVPADAPPVQPDHTGSAMIALVPKEAASLAVPGGIDAAELHITLAFLGDAADVDEDELASICTELATAIEPGTGTVAGPAAFVNDPDPDDPTAQVPLVALIDSDWACDVYAALDAALDTSGIDQPSEHGFIPHMTIQYADAPTLLTIPKVDFTFDQIVLVVGTKRTAFPLGGAMTASAMGATPDEPPVAWFEQPKLVGPTALTVTDEGRVYGHIATWGTCHTGFSGQCVMAPKSRSGYAYFNLGELRTAEGDRVSVGQITLDTRHADLAATRKQAQLHYDHTGTAVADVRAGEDRWGIWVSGAVRPEVPAVTLRKFRGAKISGDWRKVPGSGLELVAALAVNIPGFPIPRTQARTLTASGEVTALITGEIQPGLSPERMISALAYMAEHGDQTIESLVASAEIAAHRGLTIPEALAIVEKELAA